MKSRIQYTKGVVGLLVLLLTVGLGILFLIEHFRLPGTQALEKTILLIAASALLPAGVLWAIEHYFLVKPLQDEYGSIQQKREKEFEIMRQKLENRIDDLETLESIRAHGLRAISTERGPLVRQVLQEALNDPAVHEIIIVGSTLDGLTRRARWFEQFVKSALKKDKKMKLMFTHWDYVTHRERQEDRPDGAIAQELKNSLSKVLRWGIPSDCIRLAYGAPTVFMVIAGNNMILNPYPFGGESVTSAAIWLTNPDPSLPTGPPGSIWREYYINHYDKPWNPDKPEYRRMNNKDPNPLSYSLPSDWIEQLDRFIEGIVRERLKEHAR